LNLKFFSYQKKKIDQFLKEKPELAAEFDMYIDNIQRLRPHTLTEAEEKILASFGLISDVQVMFMIYSQTLKSLSQKLLLYPVKRLN